MIDYPYWSKLPPADRLRIAALEAELAGVDWVFVRVICEAADTLEGPPIRAKDSLLAFYITST